MRALRHRFTDRLELEAADNPFPPRRGKLAPGVEGDRMRYALLAIVVVPVGLMVGPAVYAYVVNHRRAAPWGA
jgi:hypothetical protein